MSTAYNIRNQLAKSSNADRASRLDPGSGGTIVVSNVDRATVVCSGAGTRTLEDATGLGVGTEILICSISAGVVVNGKTLAAGEYTLARVIPNSSGVNAWVNVVTTGS